MPRQTSVGKGEKVKSTMQYVCSLGWIGVAAASPGWIGSKFQAGGLADSAMVAGAFPVIFLSGRRFLCSHQIQPVSVERLPTGASIKWRRSGIFTSALSCSECVSQKC